MYLYNIDRGRKEKIMKVKTLGFFTAAAAIAVLVLMDHWSSLQQIKVFLVSILIVVAGNLL